MHRFEASLEVAQIPRDVHDDEHETARLRVHHLLRSTDADRTVLDGAVQDLPDSEQDRVRAVLDGTDLSPLPRVTTTVMVDGAPVDLEVQLLAGRSVRAAIELAIADRQQEENAR